MSNIFKKLIACALLLAVSFSTISCSSKKKKKEEEAAANASKFTLNVYSFTSGFGSEWLTEAEKVYEELNKDVVIGDKKGINIEIQTDKSGVPGANIASGQNTVYFLEQQDYYELVGNNYVADITSAVTGVNKYDNKKLEDKLFQDQKNYLNRDGRYYAYPHYFTSFGIVYDVDLFNEKGYYFAEGYDKNGELRDMFLGAIGVQNGWAKTAGPDNVAGNSDDGLPTTYEEFLLLCRFISEIGNDNPLIWSGQHRSSYLTHFINALATDYEGYEQMRLNFTFNGAAKNLISFDASGNIVESNATTITQNEYAELARQAGKYYAMDFYSNLYNSPAVINDGNRNNLLGSTYSHKNAQEDFLILNTKRNAMLLDGSWWETEASAVFKTVEQVSGSQYSKQNRKLGWMPLPKQNESLVGAKQTMYDIYYPLTVVKGGVDVNSDEYKWAIDFIQFMNSDSQIAKFNQLTGCTKALKYDLSADQYNSLTYFGKSFYNAYKNADIVFPYDKNSLFANNQKIFQELDFNGTGGPLYKSTAYSTSFISALESGVSAKTYFEGMYTYFKNLNLV